MLRSLVVHVHLVEPCILFHDPVSLRYILREFLKRPLACGIVAYYVPWLIKWPRQVSNILCGHNSFVNYMCVPCFHMSYMLSCAFPGALCSYVIFQRPNRSCAIPRAGADRSRSGRRPERRRKCCILPLQSPWVFSWIPGTRRANLWLCWSLSIGIFSGSWHEILGGLTETGLAPTTIEYLNEDQLRELLLNRQNRDLGQRWKSKWDFLILAKVIVPACIKPNQTCCTIVVGGRVSPAPVAEAVEQRRWSSAKVSRASRCTQLWQHMAFDFEHGLGGLLH